MYIEPYCKKCGLDSSAGSGMNSTLLERILGFMENHYHGQANSKEYTYEFMLCNKIGACYYITSDYR